MEKVRNFCPPIRNKWKPRGYYEIATEFGFWIAAFAQVLILEPSKVLQPAIVCVSEEDESRTVQLKHVTPLKVCRPSAPPPPPPTPRATFLSECLFPRLWNVQNAEWIAQ